MSSRTDTFFKMAIAAALGAWSLTGFAQTPATAPATAPAPTLTIGAPATAPAAAALAPATAPATVAPDVATSAPAPSPAPATAPAIAANGAVTQPFIANVTADKVYVRSGPGTAYYELGQLGKGDRVYVVGEKSGWYEILPPNGVFGMIAKEMVDPDVAADGTGSATVNKDYVNLRAGTSINKTRDPSVVLNVLRKGTKLHVLGATDQYFEVNPTEQTHVYISPQFVKQADGATIADYRVPTLKLPPGVSGPAGSTVEAPTAPPTLAGNGGTTASGTATDIGGGVVPTPGPIGQVITTPAAVSSTEPSQVATTAPATQPQLAPLPPLKPKVVYSEEAAAKYKDAGEKYLAESKKAPSDQDVDSLLKQFQDIAATENVSPSVKAGAQADIDAIQRTLTVQRLIKEQTAAEQATRQQSAALQEQYESAERAIAAAREIGPYSAQGLLQTSTIVQGKYALVNPQTGRVVAYVDPATASVDIGSLVGKYIGVRGISKQMPDSDITVIQVSSATLMPTPATMPANPTK